MSPAGARLTMIITSGSSADETLWGDFSLQSDERLVIMPSRETSRREVLAAVCEATLDVERVILDRAVSPLEFLDLLSELPCGFQGDILFIREDGGGFLSAAGRGGNRVLYRVRSVDVEFYLRTHHLIRNLECTA